MTFPINILQVIEILIQYQKVYLYQMKIIILKKFYVTAILKMNLI